MIQGSSIASQLVSFPSLDISELWIDLDELTLDRNRVESNRDFLDSFRSLVVTNT
jgi:hypothetical protein